ncbi:MAG: hypothetical protein ACE37K_09690 [Planctomycetota bacterium]
MNAPRPSLLACTLRAVSPALLVTLSALLCASALVVRHVGLVRDAVAVQQRVERARLVLAADTALLAHAPGLPLPRRVEVGARTYEVDTLGERLRVTTVGGDQQVGVVAAMLPGDSPRALSVQRSACGDEVIEALDGAVRLPAGRWPRLRAEALRTAACATRLLGLRRDPEVALRTFSSGTDREDYVLEPPPGPFSVDAGLLRVPGNLWLVRDCTLELPRDLVVVVHGNVYLRASLRVRGAGRLVVLTQRSDGDVVFRDLDGSGGWSPGDTLVDAVQFVGAVEGGGGVRLGSPGCDRILRCDAALLVAGELRLESRAIVCGPLAVRGVLTAGADGRLLREASAEWAFPSGRAELTAFEMRGLPRPGPLEFLAR